MRRQASTRSGPSRSSAAPTTCTRLSTAPTIGAQTGRMRTPLSADEVAAALRELPAWSGDTARLVRTVPGTPEELVALRAAVDVAADELDHHPSVVAVPGGLRFTLWTHSRGAVTELDVALARRIDALAG